MAKDQKVSSLGVPYRDINAATRAAMAISLRAQKLTYEVIAERTGYGSASACRKAVMREMDRVVVRNVDALRNEEIYMLDTIHATIWPLIFPVEIGPDEDLEDYEIEEAKQKSVKANLSAVDRILAISEARRKLLSLDVRPDAIPDGITIIRSYGVDVSLV